MNNEIHSFPDSFPASRFGGRFTPVDVAIPRTGARQYEAPARPAAGLQPGIADLCLAVLDEIDHGLLVLGNRGEVKFANRAAWRASADASHPLQIHAGAVELASSRDQQRLQRAVDEAIGGRRSMVDLGTDEHRHCVALVPLATASPVPTVLLILGRQGGHDVVALQLFAKTHGLTAAETSVLVALSEGHRPREIAERHGVAICTVRTQIRDMRIKTATASIGALMRLVGRLPPMALSAAHWAS